VKLSFFLFFFSLRFIIFCYCIMFYSWNNKRKRINLKSFN